MIWRLISTSFFAGAGFGVAMSVLLVPVYYLLGQVKTGVLISAAAGVLFALLIGGFCYVAERRFRACKVIFHPGEYLVHQGPANHFVGHESVGGWLRLTNQRLFFQSHTLNHFVHGWDAPLQQVTGIKLCLTLLVVPNGIRVATSQGIRQFVVSHRKEWQQKIEHALNNLPKPYLEQTS